jgi:hypothetical protein
LGPAGTGVTTIPADTGSLAGAPEEADAHRAHLQEQRVRARAEPTVGLILDADDLGSPLVDWLNEVVHLHEARGVRQPFGTARC